MSKFSEEREKSPIGAIHTIKMLQIRIAQLELKLEDTIDLLHMWKNEACSYEWLAKAMANGDYSLQKAKQSLNRASTGIPFQPFQEKTFPEKIVSKQ